MKALQNRSKGMSTLAIMVMVCFLSAVCVPAPVQADQIGIGDQLKNPGIIAALVSIVAGILFAFWANNNNGGYRDAGENENAFEERDDMAHDDLFEDDDYEVLNEQELFSSLDSVPGSFQVEASDGWNVQSQRIGVDREADM